MSNDRNQNSNNQPAKSTEKTEPTAAEKAIKELTAINRLVTASLKKLYRVENQFTAQGTTIVDIRKTPNGLLVFIVPSSGQPASAFALIVGSHPNHIKPAESEKILREWNQIVESGALRQ